MLRDRDHRPTDPPRTQERVRWHRPLLVLSMAMVVLAVVSVIGLAVDPRTIVGAPAWAKPLKFAISIAVYSVTLSWLIGLLPRWRRVAWWSGTIAAIFLVVEIVIIVAAVVDNTTSHFNVSSPTHALIWVVMAASISIVWTAALPVMVVLLRTPLGSRARTIAIRGGFALGLLGMALAVLMTLPTPAQLTDFEGISGAHAVGIPDDGPGLPILGWSTVGGDLRIPHFVGMHALQLIPLIAIGLELLSRRVQPLRSDAVRTRIVWVSIALTLGVLSVLTVQALAGESIVRPSAPTIATSAALFLAAAIVVVLAMTRSARPLRHEAVSGAVSS